MINLLVKYFEHSAGIIDMLIIISNMSIAIQNKLSAYKHQIVNLYI